MTTGRFLVLGNNIFDTVFRVPGWQRDSKVTASAYDTYGGGQAANAAWTLAACGCRVVFCGRFGAGEEGRLTSNLLRSIGVDLAPSLFAEQGRTARAAIIVDEGRNDRTIVMHFDPDLLRQTLDPPRSLDDICCFYWDGYEIETASRLLELCKQRNIMTCGNLEVIDSAALALLDKLDVVIMPKQIYCGAFEDGSDCGRLLSGRLPAGWESKTVVVTSGSEGSIGVSGGIVTYAPAERAAIVDTTGAGDAFSAGLILQMAQGIDLAASLKFASRLGALACETPGPRADPMRIRELTKAAVTS
jgi:sugar/nucleoside kinase (ribokinase family)